MLVNLGLGLVCDDDAWWLQPGHTNGHTALVYKSVVAFTGDHIAQMRTTKKLGAFETFCWYR